MPLVILPVGLWGANLTGARESAGLTRCRLAELVGRHESTVSRWESGSRTPQPTERRLLAWLLDVEVDVLFPPSEPPVVAAARRVAVARTVPDLQRAVAHLRTVLDAHDALGEKRTA